MKGLSVIILLGIILLSFGVVAQTITEECLADGTCTLECTTGQIVGDLDGNGLIEETDANIMTSVWDGSLEIPDDISCLDINGDGVVDTKDILDLITIWKNQDRDYQCTENQTILKLSDMTNAHGAIYSDTIFGIEICYDELFGKEFSVATGASLRGGDAGDVLTLTGNANAHAQVFGGDTVVDFGDLICNKREVCLEGETLIVSLSSESNAHLAVDDTYAVQICCTSAFAGSTCNSNGQCEVGESCSCSDCGVDETICSNGLICNSETNLCEGGTQCAVGQTLCSDGICKSDCGSLVVACNNDGICSDDNGVLESCQCSDCYGRIDSCSLEGDEQLICDFRTNSCQLCPNGGTFDSNTLTCTDNPNPIISIVEPARRVDAKEFKKFKVDKIITFDQEITNKDELLRDVNVEWNFGNDDTLEISNCLTTGECDTTKVFDTAGYKRVSVSALEVGDDFGKSSDFTEILIYKSGLNLFSIISKPNFDTLITSNTPIKFDASQSFVAECFSSNSVCKAEENAGELPCYAVGDLWCYDYPQPDDTRYSDFGEYEFMFKWTFDEDEDGEEVVEGIWTRDDDKIISFDRKFEGDPGTNHTIKLVTKYRYFP